LLFVILGLAAFSLAIGLLQGLEFTDIFMATVALAVGAIPEGLPAAITIMLSLGVSKMAKRKAIIRKLVAVETLGSTTVICSDKTGTLTENQMTVKKIFSGDNIYKVGGQGYSFDGQIFKGEESVNVEEHKALRECLLTGLLCNESNIEEKDGRNEVNGDPTEGALLVAAQKAKLNRKELEKEYRQLDQIPFESEYQYMATLHEKDGKNVVFIKGALEAIADRSKTALHENGQEVKFHKDKNEGIVEKLASEGLSVLAFAKKETDITKISHEDIEDGLVFLGLQGMIDPPREEVKKAVHLCQQAGIKVKMITGSIIIKEQIQRNSIIRNKT
jgi:cation-transporting P-type ATPase F